MVKLAKYELLAKIASGGMAEIYVARPRDVVGGRVCVVKKLLPQHAANEDFIQMFLDEGRIAAMFDHPNIVRMHDFGSEDGNHYLAMEYLHGEDLRTVLRAVRAQTRPVPLPIAIAVISAVCAGLHHAHDMTGPSGEALEIVHRDVSPHNVFVCFDGTVKVVDFGIAKSTDRKWETKHGTLKGKVPYMAPEQIKGRRLDRRADVYAVGVMLYELALGRRPYVLATGGDFAMMMAIARHDVRAPSVVDPTIPPELERIILRAIAYDAKQRHASAEALKADLDGFAAAAGLDTSATAVASFLAGLFEARVTEWRDAQNAQRDLAMHVVQVEEQRAHSVVFDDDADDATQIDEIDAASTAPRQPSLLPAGSAACMVASTSAAVGAVIEIFGVTVVTLQGAIDESFDGKSLGGSLSGAVLFDMAGVERITSFGVREWLEMMTELEQSEDVDAYLARCSEPVVTQLSMIRAFAGRAKVLSFDVPFLCDDCGNAFVRTLDCAHDAAMITGAARRSSPCPRCGGEAKLDDDPAYLAFAAPFAGRTTPEQVRVVMQRLAEGSPAGRDPVDKVVTATETRVRVHRDLDPAFRWHRVLDGLEGVVVVDFRGVPRFGHEGAGRFARAITALGAEVSSCEIVECPVEVAVALGAAPRNERVRVATLTFEGRCGACAATRTGTIPVAVLERSHRSGVLPFVPCRRCNGALGLGDLAPAMNALFAGAGAASAAAPPVDAAAGRLDTSSNPVVIAVGAEGATVAARPSDASRADAKDARTRVGGPRWAIVAGVAAALGLAVGSAAIALRGRGAGDEASAVVSTPSAAALPSATPAGSFVERRADGVYAVVTVRSATEDDALAEARTGAISRMLPLLEHDIDPVVRHANAASDAKDTPAAAAARFVEQVGVFASPDRVDVKRRTEPSSVVLTATYRIASAGWQRAIAHYSETRTAGGVTFARAFPSRARGFVVVATDASTAPAFPVGALVDGIDGRPATSLDALPSMSRGRHVAALVLRGERLEAKISVK